MFGFKIALTGLLFAFIGMFAVQLIGKKEMPPMVVAIPVLLSVIGGVLAMIVGLLVSIWL